MYIDHGNIKEVALEMMLSEKVKDIKYAMSEFKRLGYLVETTQMRTRLNELSKKIHTQDVNNIIKFRTSLLETKEQSYIDSIMQEAIESEDIKEIKEVQGELLRLGHPLYAKQLQSRLKELSVDPRVVDDKPYCLKTKEQLYMTLSKNIKESIIDGYQCHLETRVEITKFDNGYFCELLDEGDVDLNILLTLIDTRFEYPLMSTSFNEPFYIWFDGAVSYTTDVNSGEYFEVDDTESLNRALAMFDKNQRRDIVARLYQEKYI